MSVVYRAYDPSLDRHVALKLIPPWEDELAFARLEREARAMAQLSHPHVATVYEVGQHDGRCFISMELVEGQTMKDWVSETARPWTEVLRAYLQAGRGLAAAHRAGLVHRDFKPSNVLIGDDGRVRVVDFGLARPVAFDGSAEVLDDEHHSGELLLPDDEASDRRVDSSHVTVSGVISGTPAYMSPEQHRGGLASVASDQFAFAVTLWEALYRERPFPGRTPFAVTHAITEGLLQDPPRTYIPGWVEAILRRALAHAPEDRYESMGDMLAAFFFTWQIMYR